MKTIQMLFGLLPTWTRKALLVVCLLTFALAYHASAQGDVAPPLGFAPIFFLPFAVGMIAHWIKKFTETGGTITFATWYLNNFGWTMAALVVGLTALYGAVNGLLPSFQTFLTAFLVGFAADSVNQPAKK